MANIHPGDIVRYLNAVGGGRVTRIADNIAYVDEDGFETPVLVRECVVVRTAEQENADKNRLRDANPDIVAHKPAPAPKKDEPKAVAPAPATYVAPEEAEEEVPGGDVLNIVLGFESTNLQKLSESDYEAYLINDSNYYLYFSLLAREKDTDEYTTLYAGIVEPNIQLHTGTFSREDVGRFEHIALQYIAFKRNKPFARKNPAFIDIAMDVTKFYKLHCFKDNVYFENPVIAIDFVHDDVPADRRAPKVDPRALEREMQRKKAADRRPVRKKISKSAAPGEKIVVDLHITELVDNTRGLSNADMLNLQVDKFREVMDAHLHDHGRKIIFIHGKGEGVLRQALMKELNHRYKGHDVQDASFQEYGFGATQVTI